MILHLFTGCLFAYLGLETDDNEELVEMDNKVNKKFSYEQAFVNINNAGLGVFGAFIYGNFNETTESISRRTKYIIDSRINSIQITLMTPLPGTKLYKQLLSEKRIIYDNYPKDWGRYTMGELIFKPYKITGKEMKDALEKNFNHMFSPLIII